MLVALGGRAARQGNQAGLRPVIHLAVPAGLNPVLEHTVQSALGEAPLDVEYRALGHVQGLGHPGRRPSLAGFQQNAGPGRNPGRTLSGTNHMLRLLALLLCQPDQILLPDHTATPQQH